MNAVSKIQDKSWITKGILMSDQKIKCMNSVKLYDNSSLKKPLQLIAVSKL